MDASLSYLLVLLLLTLLLGGLGLLWQRRKRAGTTPHGRSRQTQGDDLDTVAAWEPTVTRLMSGPEREAYLTLRAALPDHMVLAQVPLARFLKVPTRNSYAEWMRRVGSLCADFVVCDATAQPVAVVEVRPPFGRGRDRNQKRYARMDRVLEAAKIPVHVWLDNALPGAAVARETILGSAVVFTTKSGATLVDTSARAKAPPLKGAHAPSSPVGAPRGVGLAPTALGVSALPGLAVMESPEIDFDLDAPPMADDATLPEDAADDGRDGLSHRMSTWFESAQSGRVPLEDTPGGTPESPPRQ